MAATEILLQVFAIFVAAKIAASVSTRVGVPPVIGELLVGIAIGPHALGLIGLPGPGLVAAFGEPRVAQEILDGVLEALAELGVIILLFTVGLESRLEDLLRAGARAGAVALGGVALPMALGFGLGQARGEGWLTALFLGVALVATSVGITARVFADLGQLQSPAGRIVLGAAIVDDVLGMVLLAIAAGLAGGGSLSPLSIAALAAEAVGFVALVVLVGAHVVRRYPAHLSALRVRNAPFVAAMGICLGLAALAGLIGLAAIIGAFLAGLIFAEARERDELARQVEPLHDFLVPFFFVVTGASVAPALLLDPRVAGFAAILTALAIVGKLAGCGLGTIGLGWRTAALVGVGMVPRGEVGLIVAGLGQTMGVVSDTVFSVVVVMSVVTTLVAPPVLALLIARRGAAADGSPERLAGTGSLPGDGPW